MGIISQQNIVQDFMETYKINKHAFKKQRKSNKKCHPVCKCGQEMISMKSTKCYGSEFPYIICDICDQRIPTNDVVFHCPWKKVKLIHPSGFDICLKCRQQYIHRLRYFVALIICPRMTPKHSNNDADILKLLFKKLGFHRVNFYKLHSISFCIHNIYRLFV